MLQELLVIAACASNQGCSQASSLYYSTHPETAIAVKKTEKKAINTIGLPPQYAILLSPILIYSIGGQASFRLNQRLSIQVKRESVLLYFRYDF